MDRGEEISAFVRKLYLAMGGFRREFRDVDQETLNWLRTSPEYRNFIEATVPDDFSLLPNEIIYDVVDSGETERRETHYKLQKLTKIEGSWGEFARDLSVCTTQTNKGDRYDNVVFYLRNDRKTIAAGYRSREISFEEAQHRAICHSAIEHHFGVDRLIAIAPNLYDVISFTKVPDTYSKALELIGTRFTNISWCGNDPKEAATPELVTFLRRQLQSKYLRELYVYDVKFEDGAFDDQMEVFVKRRSFEYLSMGTGSYPVPFQVFKEAHKTWLALKAFELKNRALCVYTSNQTVAQLEDYFETKIEFNGRASNPFIMNHPNDSNAEMYLLFHEVVDLYRVSMNFSAL